MEGKTLARNLAIQLVPNINHHDAILMPCGSAVLPSSQLFEFPKLAMHVLVCSHSSNESDKSALSLPQDNSVVAVRGIYFILRNIPMQKIG